MLCKDEKLNLLTNPKKYGGFLQSRRTYFGKLKANNNNLALFDSAVTR